MIIEKTGADLFQTLIKNFNKSSFKKLNWTGNFNDYLDIISKNPKVLCDSWTRLYNMITLKGSEDIVIFKNKVKKYNFFSQHENYPIFGLEDSLAKLVDTIHAGALGYGPEKRVLLLHGPVGSSKSTICTLLKRGLEEYSKTDDGALYSFSWNLKNTNLEKIDGEIIDCPINEDPINIIPINIRKEIIRNIIENNIKLKEDGIKIDPKLSMCPKCQFYFDYFMKLYNGDIDKIFQKIIIKRFVLDERTRKGIGTFQPKDEKNQDSTELTGDINFRQLGRIGIDSDPRCFNFDGEFQIANRGLLEFIEILKLTKEFLYDLLGASQEKQIKPKKFSQMNIDEVLIGHSVHGDTPIPHEYNGELDVLPISKLEKLDISKLKVFSLNIETKKVELTSVKSIFKHDFQGQWIQNNQGNGMIITTPNHSVYNENYETFYPGEDETSKILTVNIPTELIENKKTSYNWNIYFINLNLLVKNNREVIKFDSKYLSNTAWDIECIENHNFIGGQRELFVLHNTNNPEYQTLQQDKKMEALRDRTIKINIPYLLKWDDEIKIYQHAYNKHTVMQHIAPHTLEMAALWAIITRLKEPKNSPINLTEKAKLYNGQSLPGWTEDKINELKESTQEEGMFGISARLIQNAISNILVNNKKCINVFMLLKEINESLDHYSLIDSEDDRKRYKELIGLVIREYDEIIKNEIQRALIGDEDAIKRLCSNYIDNVVAQVNGNKIRNPITGTDELPNERLMRSIEEKIDIGEQQVNEFRRSVVLYIGTLAQKNKQFDYKSNPRLMEALQLKLFEDTKDFVKLGSLSDGIDTVDIDAQNKIDTLKTRLKSQYGYCDHCATDILKYASSIFARGDLIEKE